MRKKNGGPPAATPNYTRSDSTGYQVAGATFGADNRSPEWRRKQFGHDVKCRRRNSRELNSLCGARDLVELVHNELVDDIDIYAITGQTLGWPERVAAGRALLEQVA